MFGNADGLVAIGQARVNEVHDAWFRRRDREAEIMRQLREGNTTIEILGLPPLQESRGTSSK